MLIRPDVRNQPVVIFGPVPHTRDLGHTLGFETTSKDVCGGGFPFQFGDRSTGDPIFSKSLPAELILKLSQRQIQPTAGTPTSYKATGLGADLIFAEQIDEFQRDLQR